MTQYVINIGTLPNDGTGDPLRTAFNETNLNFDQVFASGPVGSNIRIANNTILTTNTNGNLVLSPNGIGVVQANVNIVPTTANTRNLGSADRRWSTVYVQYANVSGGLTTANLVATGNVSAVGNITASNIVTGGGVLSGNIFTANGVYAEFGAFTGKNGRGIDAIVAGVQGGTFLGTDVIIQNTGNSNAYTQFNFQNINSGTQASTDYVITADNGNDTTRFLNIGLTNSGWDGTQNNSLGNLVGPNDGYFYVQDGNLAIGVKENDNAFIWKFDNRGLATFPNSLVTVPVPFANLIAASGARAFVNNANLSAAGNFGAQIAGGGSNVVPVWSDGSNWYIG